MRYKGYVATYVGETKKVNNDNFFLNGICKEHLDDLFVIEENKEFKSRNIYAVASGAKSEAIGDELAYIAVDILRNFHVADFDVINREFFHVANTAITSQVLERSNEHFEVDLSVLSIDRDVATVYNLGDIPVFYYVNGKLSNIAGKAPEKVELEKDFVDNSGLVKSQKYSVETIPYLGALSNDKEVIPYASKGEKLRKNSYFVMCSKDVMRVLDEKTIESVLADKKIKKKHKALSLLDQAIKKDPEGNYTIQVIAVTHGLAIASKEVDSLVKWLIAAALCICLCFNGDFILGNVSKFLDGCKALMQSLTGDDEVDPSEEYRWDTEDTEEEDDKEKDTDDEENGDVEEVFEQVDYSKVEPLVQSQTPPAESASDASGVTSPEKANPTATGGATGSSPVVTPAPSLVTTSAKTGNSASAATNSSSTQKKNTTGNNKQYSTAKPASGNPAQKKMVSNSSKTTTTNKSASTTTVKPKSTAPSGEYTQTPKASANTTSKPAATVTQKPATTPAPTPTPASKPSQVAVPTPKPAPAATPPAAAAPQVNVPTHQQSAQNQATVPADSGTSGVAQTGENELPLDN